MRPDVDTLTASLARVTDSEAGHQVDGDVRGQLAARIMATPPEDGRSGHRQLDLVGGAPRRARLLAATALAVAALVLAVGVTAHPPSRPPVPAPSHRPERLNSQQAALVFKRDGKTIDVIIRDPLADPARYNREFVARGLHITLSTAPVGSAHVGAFIFMEIDAGDDRPIKPIYSHDRCRQPAGNSGGGAECDIGLRIPVDFRASATIVVGRPAAPGEIPEDGGDAWAVPGYFAGVPIDGRRVANVLADLRAKGIVVTEFRYEDHGSDKPYPDGVPPQLVSGYWFVHNAAPGTKDEPILFVGPDPKG